MGQGAQVTAESPPAPAARQVVVATETPGASRGGHQRGPGTARQARGEGGRQRGAGAGRGSFQEGDGIAPMIGPGPGPRAARRARPEQRVHAAGGTGRERGAGQGPAGTPGTGSLAHRALADALVPGVADRPLACLGPADCFAVDEAVVDGEAVGAGLGTAEGGLFSAP